jgi:hypothetical protein
MRSLTSWGCLWASTTLMSTSLMFRYWSTEIRVPVMAMSFFNSMHTCFPTSVLKNEKKSYRRDIRYRQRINNYMTIHIHYYLQQYMILEGNSPPSKTHHIDYWAPKSSRKNVNSSKFPPDAQYLPTNLLRQPF